MSIAETAAAAAYEAAKLASESTRQSDIGVAEIEWQTLSGPQPITALTTLVRQAELDHYDRLIAAAVANDLNPATLGLLAARANVPQIIPLRGQ